MNAIDKIKAKLAAYPDVQYSESSNGIEVYPRDPGIHCWAAYQAVGVHGAFRRLARRVHVGGGCSQLLWVWALAEMPTQDPLPRRDSNQMGRGGIRRW